MEFSRRLFVVFEQLFRHSGRRGCNASLITKKDNSTLYVDKKDLAMTDIIASAERKRGSGVPEAVETGTRRHLIRQGGVERDAPCGENLAPRKQGTRDGSAGRRRVSSGLGAATLRERLAQTCLRRSERVSQRPETLRPRRVRLRGPTRRARSRHEDAPGRRRQATRHRGPRPTPGPDSTQ